jgi:hypothetical protein
VAALAAASLSLTALAHTFLRRDVLASHVFYLPAILAAIWWGWPCMVPTMPASSRAKLP